MSECGEHSLVVIALLGNVFSPRYRSARVALGERAEPLSFCSMHVALGGARSRFALTEGELVRVSAEQLVIGQSSLSLEAGGLRARLCERTAFGRRVEGCVRVQFPRLLDVEVQLDARGRHRWTPLAPVAVAHVDLEQPRLRFQGHAYLDANEGREGLEDAFHRWSWARLRGDDGSTLVTYDTEEVDGARTERTFLCADGVLVEHAGGQGLEPARLGRSWFAMEPSSRLDPRGLCSVKTMQDAPFYVRSELEARVFGRRVRGVHEWLDLQRYVNPWVQRMIPYRMRGGFPRHGEPR